MVTVAEFSSRMREFGGIEETRRSRILQRIRRRLGRVATKPLDCYDAVRITDNDTVASVGLLKRIYVPTDRRTEVDSALSDMGVSENNRYVQEYDYGQMHMQLSLDDDRRFRSYVVCRKLLDDRSEDTGIEVSEIDQSTLNEVCGRSEISTRT